MRAAKADALLPLPPSPMSARRTADSPVHYRIEAPDPHNHLFHVTLTVAEPAAQQELSLPVWIPGSYLGREFSKNLQNLAARQDGRAVAVQQGDKSNWQIQGVARSA